MPQTAETVIVILLLKIIHSRPTHKYLMERRPAQYCKGCLVSQIVEHFLVECPNLGDCHVRCLTQCHGKAGQYHFKLVLGLGSCHPGDGTLSFLEKFGLYIDLKISILTPF